MRTIEINLRKVRDRQAGKQPYKQAASKLVTLFTTDESMNTGCGAAV